MDIRHIHSLLHSIENKETPRGDGNPCFLFINTPPLIENKETPRGDGNYSRIDKRNSKDRIENKETPRGDGN